MEENSCTLLLQKNKNPQIDIDFPQPHLLGNVSFTTSSSSSFSLSSPVSPSMATTTTTTTSPFPQEIETEILIRLPPNSLQRFTTVCKSWHSIITHPNFISTHFKRSSLSPHLLLLRHPLDPISSTTSVEFSLSSESFIEKEHTLLVPTNSNDQIPKRVELLSSGGINGIVCVVVFSGFLNGPEINCDMFLWNPSSGENVKVPVSEISGLFCGPPMVTFFGGFGYDEIGDDYKVLRVVNCEYNSVHGTVEVYSLRENCWRVLGFNSQSGIPSNIICASSRCTFLDGIGYWGAYRKERKYRFFVLGFDFCREKFKKVRLPVDCVDGREMRYHSLWVYKGSLALSVLRFGEFESRVTRHYIWVMTVAEGLGLSGPQQWVKMFDIDLEVGPRKPVAMLKSGDLLLLGQGNGDHVLYDVEDEEVKSVDVYDFDDAVPYVESLVSLHRLMPN